MLLFLANNIFKAKVKLLFEDRKQQIIYLLALAASLINFTTDAWTSTNKLAFLGKVAYFVDKNGGLQTLLLLLLELQGVHSGENIAALVLKTLSEFQFYNKLDYFVIDNADNNDKIIQAIALSF